MTRAVMALIVVTTTGVFAQEASKLEFDVASIKRNTTNTFATGPGPNPASGQVSMINVPIQLMLLRAYPLETLPVLVIGLPDWAESDRYDVVAKGKPGATPDEQQQMWRALLAERTKLQAHYETRERAGYNLVFARSDKRLGPHLQPSTLDCTKPPGPLNPGGGPIESKTIEAMAMARCGALSMMGPAVQGVFSGGMTMANLVRMMSSFAGRPVIDRTGLDGTYAISLRFARETPMAVTPGTPAPPGDEAPSLFTAVQEEFGLKLEATTVQGQVLVINHIERPTED